MGRHLGLSDAETRAGCVPGRSRGRRRCQRRRGSATIDYFLLICIVIPLAAFILRVAPRAMQSVYDLLTVVVAWPFL